MAISSMDDYRSSLRERPSYLKVPARSSTAARWCTLWDGTGDPGAGTLAVGNTANGVVPTDATTGAPTINFGSGTGYLTLIDGTWGPLTAGAGAGRVVLYDRLFHAGAYAFNAATSLSSQPSYSSRVPGGTDYKGTQIWVEVVTTFTGNLTVAVTYTDQDGNAGATTGTFTPGVAPAIGNMYQLPLAEGDSGVQVIESVTSTVASVGTFNVLVIRPLWMGRFLNRGADASVGTPPLVTDYPVRHWMDVTGMPQVFGNSCLASMYITDTTSTATYNLSPEVASL